MFLVLFILNTAEIHKNAYYVELKRKDLINRSKMSYFHYRCGDRITLLHDNCTAVRNDSDFDHGIVISAEPLVNDVLFEVKIDRKASTVPHSSHCVKNTLFAGCFVVWQLRDRSHRS